ncbi:sulfotransferase [Saccharospirillum sp. HFRX-1]|uniref:sulfotransferase n=1 Tax=unclassified Saccharospirillum TaxID=2633430 RepID=UPI00371ABA12
MGHGFKLALGQWLLICLWTLKYLPYGGWRHLPKRALMYLLAVPALTLLQVVHWVGFLCDELFFRRYRQVEVHRPVFISGVPRSGTTHLHRVLSHHQQLTSMRTWECLFAPSISERYLVRALGWLCSPLARLFGKVRLPFLKQMDAIHQLGLQEPEEDFLSLLPVNGCFLVVVLFPEEASLWRLVRFDSAMPTRRKQTLMRFYRRMIQKHLYFHGVRTGTECRYLCKNPSFASWLTSLRQQFPDADFALCIRPAQKTLPSQLSSLLPGWQLFHGPRFTPAFEQRIVGMLAGYYRDIDLFCSENPNARLVPMQQLTADLDGTVSQLLVALGLPMTLAYRAALDAEIEQAQQYRSGHQYQQQAFNVRWDEVAHRFDADCAQAGVIQEVA